MCFHFASIRRVDPVSVANTKTSQKFKQKGYHKKLSIIFVKSLVLFLFCFASLFKKKLFFRAEGLKESQSKLTSPQAQDRTGPSGAKVSGAASAGGSARQFFPLGQDFSLHDRPQPNAVRAVQSSEPQGQRYTAEEIEVLR